MGRGGAEGGMGRGEAGSVLTRACVFRRLGCHSPRCTTSATGPSVSAAIQRHGGAVKRHGGTDAINRQQQQLDLLSWQTTLLQYCA